MLTMMVKDDDVVDGMVPDAKAGSSGGYSLFGGSHITGLRGESVLSDQARVLLFTQHAKAFLIRTNDSRVVQVETPENTFAESRSVP